MSAEQLKDTGKDIEDMAAFWIVRLGAPDCTPEDRFAFDAWKRENPAHEDAFNRLQRGNAYLDRFMTEPDFQARIERARERSKPPLWRERRFQFAAAAAVLLAVALSVVLLTSPFSPNGRVAAFDTYETKIGERSTVTLADGSIVTINTNSRIEVDYTADMREIRLTRGQGYFEVAKDMGRPFVVEAGDKRVVALGTVFDVRFDKKNEVQVTLLEGLVQVDDVQTPEAAAPRQVELKPGERLVARADAAPEILETDGIEETSWRKGQLVFRSRPLADVVAEMNRYSAQKIILDDDERVLALKVSGVFNSGGRAATFVDALEAMHSLEARRSGQNQLTLAWRE